MVDITEVVGPFILGVPLRAWPALLLWLLGTIVLPWILVYYLLWKIEKSGVKRRGACGKVFRLECDSEYELPEVNR